jgi:hypothetical protein
VPPGAHVLPDTTIEGLAAIAASIGLDDCTSYAVHSAEAAPYQMGCTGADPAARAKLSVGAYFLTMEAVHDVYAAVDPDSVDVEISDSSLAAGLLGPVAGLVGGNAAQIWVQERVGDSQCWEHGCSTSLTGVLYSIQLGSRGGVSLWIEPDTM